MGGFIGRHRELALLAESFDSPRSGLLPIYGRRRVGKSRLIREFISDKPAIYLVGKTAPAGLQQKELLREAARVLGEPLLAEISPEGWRQVLDLVVSRWRGPGKLVLALDEFQWLAGASPELPSVLQELWDRGWSDSGELLLILCGSYIGFMEREVLGARSPLFGRRTGQLRLRPFGYREARAFHPDWSLIDAAKAYFICGGVPAYMETFEPTRSILANLERSVLDEHGVLFREPDFLLREELRDVHSYYAVLMAIAGGAARTKEIARRAGLPERSVPYYLQQLSELGYVGRRYALTGNPPAARNVRFALDDPLLRFWFRFVFPNLSFAQQMGAKRTLRDRVRPELDSYFGGCFERLCREGLAGLYHREVDVGFEIGEYWDKQVQIDVVGVREDGWIDLGECKWGTVRSPKSLQRELEAKVAAFPNPRGATLARHLFVRKKPARAAVGPNLRWHDLADLYAE